MNRQQLTYFGLVLGAITIGCLGLVAFGLYLKQWRVAIFGAVLAIIGICGIIDNRLEASRLRETT